MQRPVAQQCSIPDVATISDVQIRLDRSLRQGSYGPGAVYEGTWRGTEVAVKRLRDVFSQELPREDSLQFLRDFAREWRAIGRQGHPNIVQFWGIFEPNGVNPALVMEKLGMTIAERYAIKPFLSDWQALRLGMDVLRGLNHLHAQSVFHGNLACTNVLLTSGLEPTAKLAGVGMVRYLKRLPSTHVPEATLAYMSPESLFEDRPPVYDHRHDMFSFGVMLLATLIRREPSLLKRRPGHTEVERRQGDLEQLGEEHPLRRMIVRCLQDNPAERPTAVALLQECRELLNSAAIRPWFTASRTNAALSELHTIIGVVLTDRNDAMLEITQARQDLADAQQQHRQLSMEHAALQEQERLLRETIAEKTSQLDVLNRRLGEKEQELRGLNEQLEEKKSQIHSFQERLEEDRAQHAAKTDQYEQTIKQAKKRQRNLDKKVRKVKKQKERQREDFEEELSRLKEEHASAIESLSTELDQLRVQERNQYQQAAAAKSLYVSTGGDDERLSKSSLVCEAATADTSSENLSEEDEFEQWKTNFQGWHEMQRDNPGCEWQSLPTLNLNTEALPVRPRKVMAAEHEGFIYIGINSCNMWRSACDDLESWEHVSLVARCGVQLPSDNRCVGIFPDDGRLLMICAKCSITGQSCTYHLFELACLSEEDFWVHLTEISNPQDVINCAVSVVPHDDDESTVVVFAGGKRWGEVTDKVWAVELQTPGRQIHLPSLPRAIEHPWLELDHNGLMTTCTYAAANPRNLDIYKLDLSNVERGWQFLFTITSPVLSLCPNGTSLCNGHFLVKEKWLSRCYWYDSENRKVKELPSIPSAVVPDVLTVIPLSDEGLYMLAIGAASSNSSARHLIVLQLSFDQEED